jgi:hypothetical protein
MVLHWKPAPRNQQARRQGDRGGIVAAHMRAEAVEGVSAHGWFVVAQLAQSGGEVTAEPDLGSEPDRGSGELVPIARQGLQEDGGALGAVDGGEGQQARQRLDSCAVVAVGAQRPHQTGNLTGGHRGCGGDRQCQGGRCIGCRERRGDTGAGDQDLLGEAEEVATVIGTGEGQLGQGGVVLSDLVRCGDELAQGRGVGRALEHRPAAQEARESLALVRVGGELQQGCGDAETARGQGGDTECEPARDPEGLDELGRVGRDRLEAAGEGLATGHGAISSCAARAGVGTPGR